MEQQYDIFVSYSRADKDTVFAVVSILEKRGLKIWIDYSGVKSGDDYKNEIVTAIESSATLLFFSSKNSANSANTTKEVGIAVSMQKHVIPVKLDNAGYNKSVIYDLINADYIEYKENPDEACDRILDSVKSYCKTENIEPLPKKSYNNAVPLNKKHYSGLLTFVLLTLVVIVLLVVYLSISQRSAYKESIEISRMEHQPTFVVKESLRKSSPDSPVYDCADYLIENVGARVKIVNSISVKSFIEVKYDKYALGAGNSEKDINVISYIPVIFYGATSTSSNVTGKLSSSIKYDSGNNAYFADMYSESIDYNMEHDNEAVFVALINYYIITYVDIYNVSHQVYMRGDSLSTKEEYEKIKSIADQDFKNKIYDISKVNLDVFWTDCAQIEAAIK